MSTRARVRSLEDQLEAVVDADRGEVGWWGLAWGVAALEGRGILGLSRLTVPTTTGPTEAPIPTRSWVGLEP